MGRREGRVVSCVENGMKVEASWERAFRPAFAELRRAFLAADFFLLRLEMC